MQEFLVEVEEVLTNAADQELVVRASEPVESSFESHISVSPEVTPDPYATAVPLPTAVPSSALEANGTSAEGAVATMAEVAETAYIPSSSSSQMMYFAGIVAGDPWMDYYAFYNGDDYYMYYGYDLAQGDTCSYIHMRYDSYSQYTVTRGTSTFPSATTAAAAYSNVYADMAHFSEAEVVRNGSFVTLALVAGLALWLLNRILFR